MDVNYLEYNNSQYSNNYVGYLDISELSFLSISSFSKSASQLNNIQNSLKITEIKNLHLMENFSIKEDFLIMNNNLFSKNSSILVNISNSNMDISNETNYIQIIFSNFCFLSL